MAVKIVTSTRTIAESNNSSLAGREAAREERAESNNSSLAGREAARERAESKAYSQQLSWGDL